MVEDTKNEDVNKINDWDKVKRQFLAAWDNRVTIRTICINLTELTQHSMESVQLYYLWVAAIFRKFVYVQPNIIIPDRQWDIPAAVTSAIPDSNNLF